MFSASSTLRAADQAGDEVELLRRATDLVPTASASFSPTRRGAFCLAHDLPLALLVGGVAGEVAGRRELAELHADHVLVDRHRHELAAVVDVERQADELRQDGRAARPGLDRRAAAGVLRGSPPSSAGDSRRTDLSRRNGPSGLPLLLRVTRTDDHLVRRLVVDGCGRPWSACPTG